MPKTFLKNIFLEMKSSLGRFLSILSIVAIGVAFFAGVKASAPDMKYSADQYFDQQNLQDIQIYSTLGLTKEDVKAIQEIKGVKTAQGVFSMDVLTQKENTQLVLKLFSLPDKQNVNTIRLIDGRMPKKENECLIEAESATNQLFGGLKIGDTITLTSGTETSISDSMKSDTYTIVGTCYTPTYLSYQKGSSEIGSGNLDSFIFVPETNILSEYYTEVDVLVKGAKEYNSYDEEYFDVIDPVLQRIEKIADDQIEIRIQESQDALNEQKKEFDTQIQDASSQIEEAKEKLTQGQNELDQGSQQLAASRNQLDSGWADYYNSLALLDNLPTLENAIAEIEKGESSLPQVNEGIAQIQSGLDLLIQKQSELQETYDQAIQTKPTLEATLKAIEEQLALDPENTILQTQKETVSNQLSLIEQAITGYESIGPQIESLQSQLTNLQNTKAQIENGIAQKATLISQRDALYNAQVQLQEAYNQLVEGEAQYASGLQEIENAKQELQDGQAQLNKNIEEFESQKQSGSEQIDEAQKQIDELEGEWIVSKLYNIFQALKITVGKIYMPMEQPSTHPMRLAIKA